jgi:hypothetical protein
MVHHWPIFHTTALFQQSQQPNRSLRPFEAHENSRRNVDAGLIGAPRSQRKAGSHSIPESAVKRYRPLPFEQATGSVGLNMGREEQTSPFLKQSRSWQHVLQIFHTRSLIADHVPDRSQPKHISRTQIDHPEELVWRRVTPIATEVAEAESRQEVSASVERPALRTFQSLEPAKTSAPTERSTAAQIISLDPGFLDRLTDDVIRRVEKRAQIERQRRGL